MAVFALARRGFAVYLILVELFLFAQLSAEVRLYTLGAAVLCAVYSAFAKRGAYHLLGALLILLPVFGSHCMLSLLGAWLLGRVVTRERLSFPPGRLTFALELFTVIYVFGFLSSLLWDFDHLLFASLFEYGALSAVAQFLRSTYVPWYSSLGMLLTLGIAGILFIECRQAFREGHFEPFCFGLALASLFLLLYGVAQIFDLVAFVQLNRGAFWRHVGRYNATLSDPNALGVLAPFIAGTLFSIVWQKEKAPTWMKVLYGVIGLSVLLVALWSGSRSLWLALGVLVLGAWWILSRERRVLRLSVLSGAGLLLFSLCVPAINEPLQEASSTLPAAKRALETLHFEQASEMFYSRSLAARVVAQIGSSRPLLGIGGGRYRLVQHSVADELGEGQGDWWDNANNYYLQIFAEQGAFGLVLLVVALWCLARESGNASDTSGDRWFQWMFTAMVLVLFTGPHIEFPEVLLFWVVLLARVFSKVETSEGVSRLGRYLPTALLGLALLGVALSGAPRHFGLYQVEQVEKEQFVWTTSHASLLWCDAQTGPQLAFRALTPGMDANPVRVQFSFAHETRSRELRSSEWQSITFPSNHDSGKRIEIAVSRAWRPIDAGAGQDKRVLGIQLRWSKGLCRRWAWQ